MPAPVIAAIIASAASAGATVYSVKKSQQAADVAAGAQRDATAAQTHTADETLQFQKDQAALEAKRAETNRQADYEQWAAREGRMSTVGQMLGLPARNIPGYVPQDPSNPSSSTSGAPRPLATIDSSKPLDPQIRDYFKAQGVPDTETPYWIAKWPELEARGRELGDPSYAVKRLAAAEIFGGGAGAPSSTPAAARTPGTILNLAPAGPATPAYVAPTVLLPGQQQQQPAPGSVLSMSRTPRYGG